MSGAMHKVAVYLGLVEEDDRFDEVEDLPDDGSDEVTGERSTRGSGSTEASLVPAGARRPTEGASPTARRVETTPARTATVATLSDRRPRPVTTTSAEARITTLHPRTYNEARAIGEHYRDGTPVIMNLSEMDDVDAKRLVDFAAGLIFGLRGSLERVTAKVFLLSPANVTVTAEDKARIAEGGFFNQS